jgi:hypothetical protein
MLSPTRVGVDYQFEISKNVYKSKCIRKIDVIAFFHR